MTSTHATAYTRPSHRVTLLLTALSLVAIVALAACSQETPAGGKVLKVGVVYLGPHELINQILDGLRQGIKESMGDQPYEIVEKHASSDKTQISTTVAATIADGLDVLVPVTTPIAQVALANAPRGLPVVFVGVTDPQGAGLVKSLAVPVSSTGVSDLAPMRPMLETIRRVMPDVKRLGFPFSPDEQPAVYSKDVVEREGRQLGFVIDARPVVSRDDLSSVVGQLVRGNDAVLVGADNGMFEAAANIAKLALDAGKPFFAADSSSVKAGAILGVTIDYRKVGIEGGRLAIRVAKGEPVASIPVMQMTEGVLELNRRSLAALKLQPLEASLAGEAKTIY